VANGLLGTEWENESEAKKREMVQEACQEAYAHEFICRLPDVSLPPVIIQWHAQAIFKMNSSSNQETV
jgi:ABC-type multidrug transport system fused ATPase/permease subunit